MRRGEADQEPYSQVFEKTDRGEDPHEYSRIDDFVKKMGD